MKIWDYINLDKIENKIKQNTKPAIPTIAAAPAATATAPIVPAAAPADPAALVAAPVDPVATLAFTGTAILRLLS